MKYQNNTAFTHEQTDKIGVLITNLGTPQAPTKKALKPYLKQFLSDPRVVEIPRLLWWFILNVIILNIRPKRSAHAYSTVWSEQGSPLMVHTKEQAIAIRKRCENRWGTDVIVEYAMRYGQPSIESTITSMQAKGVRKLLVLPLYPQYCASTTGFNIRCHSGSVQIYSLVNPIFVLLAITTIILTIFRQLLTRSVLTGKQMIEHKS